MIQAAANRPQPPVMPGLLLGLGLGGFVDGIVLHQVLQWHHMLTATDRYPSSTIAGLEANTLADGLFHAATWVLVFIGMWLAIKAWQQGAWRHPGEPTSGSCWSAGERSTWWRASSITTCCRSITSVTT